MESNFLNLGFLILKYGVILLQFNLISFPLVQNNTSLIVLSESKNAMTGDFHAALRKFFLSLENK